MQGALEVPQSLVYGLSAVLQANDAPLLVKAGLNLVVDHQRCPFPIYFQQSAQRAVVCWQSQALFERLQKDLQWEHRDIFIMGRHVKQPRLIGKSALTTSSC